MGKEPTESQGDEAPIIQSVQVPWAEADVTRVSRQSKASGSRKWHLPARVYQRRQASGEPCLLLLRYHASMPAPTNERQALERERAELRQQVEAHKNELAIAVGVNKDRRERLDSQIRRAQKRLAEVEARLAASVRHF